MTETKLYPLKFKPILKDKIWGGEKLNRMLGKPLSSKNMGESWEISTVADDISIVSQGPLKGRSLHELLQTYQRDLMGTAPYQKYEGQFPLLFKYIDAKENLSLQLHPNDELAMKRHHSLGKTEMWYVMQADEGAGIYLGFIEGTTREKYLEHLKKGTLEQLMHFEEVHPGEVFFIKPGLVHAIGKGVLLAEIQQSSDITYRVFDWNRKDTKGQARELHTDLALAAIDFTASDYKVDYPDTHNEWQQLVENQYFITRKIKLTQALQVDYSQRSSFTVFMCVAGKVQINTKNGSASIDKGETLLIPASLPAVELVSEKAELLEISV